MESVSTDPESNAVYPESRLPYPKVVIEGAIRAALEFETEPHMRDQLQVGLICLQDFLPDDQVANDARYQASVLARELLPGEWRRRRPDALGVVA